MFDDNSFDSPKTRKNKAYWRATKLVEYICQTQGFDMRIDESFINYWVNPMHRLMEFKYVPHLNHSTIKSIL